MLQILTVLFLLPIFLTSASLTFAQANQLDLTTSPLFFEFSTEKGAIITDKIRVRNNSGAPIPLQVSLQRLAPGRNSEVELSDPKGGDEFVSWLNIENQTITAGPREWTDIPFTINVPDTAAFGYYFALLLSQTPPEQEAGTAKVTGGVAVPVLINVKAPGAKAEGQLVEFKPKSFINEYLPVEFVARVSNLGNIHIKPRGNIFIRSGNNDLAILEVNQEMGSILPQAQRSFESSWTDGFLVRENGKLTVNWNKLTDFRFGRYIGQLLMVYDDGTRDITLEGTTTFWVIPYKIIGGALVVLIGLIFVIRKLLKAYVASEIKRRQE